MAPWLLRLGLFALVSGGLGTTASAVEPLDTSGIFVKRAIADKLTPEQLQAYKERLARNFAARPQGTSAAPAPDTPGDTCSAATYELIFGFPYGPISDDTTGAADNYDLPPDVTDPTCTAPATCTGAGPVGSLPRGAIYTGTGTAPDRAWRIRCAGSGSATISAQPTSAWDLALIVYQSNCSSSLADCACVSDTGLAGQAENVQITLVSGFDYFVVIDGYSTGGTPPGPTGPYTLTLSANPNFFCVPVELQRFTLE